VAGNTGKTKKKQHKKLLMFRYLKIIFTLLMFIAIFWLMDFNLNELHLEGINWQMFSFAVFLPTVINPIILNNRTKLLLKLAGIRESFWSLMRITYISTFFGALLPSSNGLDAVRMYLIERRHPEFRGKGGAAVLMERIMGITLLCVIAFISLFFVDSSISHEVRTPVFITLAVVMVFLFILFSRWLFTRISSLLVRFKWMQPVLRYCDSLLSTLFVLKFNPRVLLSLPLIAALQLSNIFLVYLLFLSFGMEISLLTHLLFIPIISILSMVPISVSGFGVREGAFAYFYHTVGVEVEWAVTVSVLYFFILIGLPALIGGVITLLSDVRISLK